MPRLRFGTGSAILPLCLCEADFSQPKQSRRGSEIATHLSGARNEQGGWRKIELTSFSLNGRGAASRCPLILVLCLLPLLPARVISTLPAREINLAISLRFLSYSPATKRERHIIVKVIMLFMRTE
jgi:hypothetical protein